MKRKKLNCNCRFVSNGCKKNLPSEIFVVITNWNGQKLLRACLKSFFENTSCPNCHVIVVDDGSIDRSVEMVELEFPEVKLIQNLKNLGFAKSNNIGINYALTKGAQYILLLNSDIIIVGKDWLPALINLIELDSNIGIVGCKLLYPDGRLQHAGGIIGVSGFRHRGLGEKDVGQYDNVQIVDYVTGAAFLIKVEVINKIGLLDEGFSPLYFEEIDWCARARFYGYNVVYTPIPALIHKGRSTTRLLPTRKTDFYYKRNWIRFFLLNFKFADVVKRIIFREFRETIINLISLNRNGKFPLVIKPDAPDKLAIEIKAWVINLRNLKDILLKRKQRFLAYKSRNKIESKPKLV